MRYLPVVFVALVALLVGCGYRGSVPGHVPQSGNDLGSFLVWEIAIGTAATGACVALALFLSAYVKGAAMWLWAAAVTCGGATAGALIVHTVLPYIPWVVGGAVVVLLVVLAVYLRRHGVAALEAKAESLVIDPLITQVENAAKGVIPAIPVVIPPAPTVP